MNELKIKPIDDESEFKRISELVKENDGYCPCLIQRNEDTKCPCKEFREQDFAGKCRCGRYIKL